MFVTLEISQESRATLARHTALAGRLPAALGRAVAAAVAVGADRVREGLQTGALGLQRQSGMLAESVTGWMIDPQIPLGAIGVPANSPAARYATILEYGGTITPQSARALAIPISREAKRYGSPRDMADLVMIPRRGKPPLLVRQKLRRGKTVGMEVHWVLLFGVRIAARHWLSRGVEAAKGAMVEEAEHVLNQELKGSA